MSSPSPSADRNLIFGLLALQMDFLSSEQLLDALHAWMRRKTTPIGEILRERGLLNERRLELLHGMVEEHVAQHGGDPHASLAALRVEASVRQDLSRIDDSDVQASLASLPATPDTCDDAALDSAAILPTAAPAASGIAGVRFRRLREHARGGLGEVFVAVDSELNREVALKEIQDRFADHPDARARFLREAEVTGKLEHPGVVPVYGLGLYPDGRPYYAMRFIRGESMQEAIRRFHGSRSREPSGTVESAARLAAPTFDSLEFRELLGRFVAVCNAVAYAHSRGVIHRDLKPANVMLGEYGETLVVDWGLARVMDQPTGEQTTAERPVELGSGSATAPTQMGQVVGTPAYMPPEQAEGRHDRVGMASDVFALGGTLYALLTGAAPYSGADVLAKARRGEVVPARQRNASVPAALEAVCQKAMANRPENRYPKAQVLAEEVQRWLAGEPVTAWPEPLSVKAGRWVRKNRVLASATAAAAVVALVLATAGSVWLQQQKEQQRLERLAQREKAGVQAKAGLKQVEELRQQYRFAAAATVLAQVRVWAEQAADGELDAAVEQAQGDLDLARELDDVRQKAVLPVEGKWNTRWLRAEYARVLLKHGLDVLAGDSGAGVERIQSSAVRESIVAALEDWAWAESDARKKQRLLQVANSADEPDKWRQTVREAVARGNRERLRQLAREVEADELNPSVVVLLALALGYEDKEATALLRRMQRAQAHDFWVNFHLGISLHKQKKDQEAAECFLLTVALRPDSAPAYTHLGLALRDQGKLDEAIDCYRKAILLDPKYAAAHNNLGVALHDQGKVDEAIDCYRQAILLDPKDALPHNNLGNALKAKGKLGEAIDCYRKAILLRPKFAAAHTHLGNALLAKGKVDEAFDCFHKAIRLDPNDAHAHDNLGVALKAQGKVDEAIDCHRKAILLDPKYAEAHSNLGNALKNQGKLDEAIDCHRKAIEIDPKYATAHYNLGTTLLRTGKVDEAIDCLRQAIRLDPKYAKAHNNLGTALLRTGKVDEAFDCYRKGILLDPKDAVAHHNLGNALRVKGKLDEAITCYRQAVLLDPKDALAHSDLGAALADTGKVDEAIEYLRKAIRLDPKLARAHNNLGNALKAKGKVDEAIDCYREAIRLDSKFANAHYSLGNTLLGKGKVDEAIDCLRTAIQLDPKDAVAHGALGQALLRQGKFSEAQKSLRRCLTLLPPGHPNRGLTLKLVQQCQQFLAADPKLQAFLAGKGAPADAAGQVQMADLAQQPYKRLYLTSARLYRDAFARQPSLADAHRYNAACAALAGTGQGKDAAGLDDAQRASWRQQALDWLAADRARLADLAKKAAGRPAVRQQLRRWLKDPDLAGVRDEPAMARLPEKERERWRKLWADVAALLKNVEQE
jgi:tetratricopeptide (TPR) repeat protein/tRNA A-37 threonylcarbamoyl transferase component Bud32